MFVVICGKPRQDMFKLLFQNVRENDVCSKIFIYEIWNQDLSFDKINMSLQTFSMFEMDENDRSMNKTEQKMYYRIAPASQYQLWNTEPLMLKMSTPYNIFLNLWSKIKIKPLSLFFFAYKKIVYAWHVVEHGNERRISSKWFTRFAWWCEPI